MKNIGLIDDKDASRIAFMRKLNLKLEEHYPGWKIFESKPFKDIGNYRQWILENEISIMIIDERLDEEKLEDGSNVKYFGSDLVIELRKYFKDIPIYCLTNVEITEKLKKSLSYFNLILSRSKFDADIDNYLNLFIKSGLYFYAEFEKELSRLGELSEKIALQVLTEEESVELQALQTRLVIPHYTEDLINREKYLEELEAQIMELQKQQTSLMEYLNKDK